MSFYRFPEEQDGRLGHHRRVALTKVDDSGEQQLVDADGLVGESFKGLVRLQPHGFSSNPPVGSEGIVHALGGRADRAMVYGLEDPKTRQKDLPVGTTVVYDDQGSVVYVKGKDGIIVNAAKGDVATTSQKGIVSVTSQKRDVTITSGSTTDSGQQPGNIVATAPKGQVRIKAAEDHVTIVPGTDHDPSKRVYLGGTGSDGHVYAAVMTAAGPSINVFARVA